MVNNKKVPIVYYEILKCGLLILGYPPKGPFAVGVKNGVNRVSGMNLGTSLD